MKQTPSASPRPRKAAKGRSSHLEEALYAQLKAAGLPPPERQYRFHKERLWRFDFAWPEAKFYVEVEGGTWGRPVTCNHCNQRVTKTTQSGKTLPVCEGIGHTQGDIFELNCEKYNTALLFGWRGLRFTSGMVKKGIALEAITHALGPQKAQVTQTDFLWRSG